jgi:hypothetical protein
MPLNNTAKHLMLDALGVAADFVSLHSADPGATGTSEITGGTPAYARKAHTWAAAGSPTGGNMDNSNAPVFDVPGSTTVAFVGMWTDATAGTFYGSFDVTDEVFGGQGTYTLTDADISIT